MESASFVESRSDLQTFHFCLCPTDKNEFVRIVFKGGKRKGMVVTAYGGFGQKAVIAHHLIAFDAITTTAAAAVVIRWRTNREKDMPLVLAS